MRRRGGGGTISGIGAVGVVGVMKGEGEDNNKGVPHERGQ